MQHKLGVCAAVLVALVVAGLGGRVASGAEGGGAEAAEASLALGVPWAGKLIGGVQLPEEGAHFFTWDPALESSPNRPWRRWGTRRLVHKVVRVAGAYAAANPDAPRVGIGDLSRPRGGIFDERFGGLGHASHQNGLDVDVYYPRRDGQELAPRAAREVDRRLAQDLLDRFVRAGAVKVFVGPNVRLRGPRRIVRVLAHHDDHMHVRLPRDPARPVLLGRSHGGREIRAYRLGNPRSGRRVLVVGCIHGTECAGVAVARRVLLAPPPMQAELWVIPNLNPDGRALRVRQNGRGVDLNRNFPSEWRPIGHRWDPEYSGPKPLSEREARIAVRLIERLRPRVTIWYHQPQGLVRAWGPSVRAGRAYARLARARFRALRWPAGTGPNWQNHRFRRTSAFVVELGRGRLAPARHARAAYAFAE